MTKSEQGVTVVGVHEAKTNLSKLLRLVESGAEVEIRRGTTPIARLVSTTTTPLPRQLGSLKGRVVIADDFDTIDQSIIDSFENSVVFPA